jgi:hypothetical protein
LCCLGLGQDLGSDSPLFQKFLAQSPDYKGKIVHRKAPKDFGAFLCFREGKLMTCNGF